MMPIPSSDDSRPDTVSNNHGSRRISREIANLQQEIRDDFDQKLKELSGLMVKFKSLLANDGQFGSGLPGAANDAMLSDNTQRKPDQTIVQFLDKNISDVVPKDIPVLTDRISDDAESDIVENVDSEKSTSRLRLVTNNDDTQHGDSSSRISHDNNISAASSSVSRFATEPARFESGLYQLNSQLYRFKLELDQELEYREEPLHIHFQHQSELAKVLQQITEKMQQEKNTGH